MTLINKANPPEVGPNHLLAVVIIGYNEGRNLSNCFYSVLKAVEAFRMAMGNSAEILFVDSQSTDDSVSIAEAHGIRVAQAPPGFRTCTNNRMTGFVLTNSKYIMFLDGDMELHEHWLAKGVSFLEENDAMAGVAGIRTDMRLLSSGAFLRIENYNRIQNESEPVDQDVGGAFLLRQTALSEIGGLEPALAPEEDYFMFCRLRSRGWQLYRIKHPMIIHWDTKLESIKMSIRHIVWHPRATIPGVILRHAFFHEDWTWRYLWHFKRALFTHLMWMCLVSGALLRCLIIQQVATLSLTAASLGTGVYCIQLWKEKKSIGRIVFAFLLRPIYLIYLVIGFMLNRPRVDFGIQNTVAYRKAIAHLNHQLDGSGADERNTS
jgi:glycosyltransferase involved in cell wall biosynthesis